MNTALQTYQFQSHQFRVIPDSQGEPLFIAKDVCDILGYTNSRDMVKKLCRQAGVSNRYVPELSNTYTLIDEGNLYRLIIKSNKPESEPFESWVCDEVLPALRKTGSYGIPHETQQYLHAAQREILRLSPRLREVQTLLQAGFSKARSCQLLQIGETTLRGDVNKLKACGLAPTANSQQQVDLFGGDL